jgi:SRSO17 transposase
LLWFDFSRSGTWSSELFPLGDVSMDRRFSERKKAMLAECEVTPELFAGMLERLRQFIQPYANQLSTPEQQGYVANYVTGLCAPVDRKTSETIAYFHDQDRQGLQRFIGSLEWDHRPLISILVQQVAAELGEADGILILDPSAFSKKGTESVGVQRQWNGRLAKVDNCQLGVYLAYASRREHALVDFRLFLPEEWARAKKRRKKCHVPDTVRFATRLKLAVDMIQEHRSVLPHAWVVGDDEFGRSTQFRRDLRVLEERYLLAVPSNTLVRDLAAEPPPYRGFGKRPMAPFVRVDAWCQALPPEAWTQVEVRDAEKGPLTVEVARTRVLAITERTHQDSEEMLVVTRRQEDSGTIVIDYWLSNADSQTAPKEFARAAKGRGRIEECFERGKGETGLADYETRTWCGWHHHQTLALLTAWFLVSEQLRGKKINTSHYRSATAMDALGLAVRSHRPSQRRTPCSRNAYPTHSQRNRTIVPLEIT